MSAARAVAVLPLSVLVILTFRPHEPDCCGALTATIQSLSTASAEPVEGDRGFEGVGSQGSRVGGGRRETE